MKGTELLYKMELIDPAYVEAAEVEARKKNTQWRRWGAVAACLAVGIAAGAVLLPRGEVGVSPTLPMLSVSFDVGMGYEGYMAYDISELVSANPWKEDMALTTLPVYQNPITFDEKYHVASGVDYGKMEAVLTEVARRLGMDAASLTITDDAPDEKTAQVMLEGMKHAGMTDIPDGYFAPTKLMAEGDGFSLSVDRFLTVTVAFDTPVPLPEDYTGTFGATYEETVAVAEYLRDEYNGLAAFDDPQIDVYGGDRNTNHIQSHYIALFEAGESPVEQITGYHFNRVEFVCKDEGLVYIRIRHPDLSNKLGDYPVITMAEAEALLVGGQYITTVPYEFPGAAYIKKAELVYRSGPDDACYMPYYRFYVALGLPETAQAEGLLTYGAYYVPAVEGAYISDMPLWNGSFNS